MASRGARTPLYPRCPRLIIVINNINAPFVDLKRAIKNALETLRSSPKRLERILRLRFTRGVAGTWGVSPCSASVARLLFFHVRAFLLMRPAPNGPYKLISRYVPIRGLPPYHAPLSPSLSNLLDRPG